MRARWLVVFLTVAGAAFCSDWEFDHIVKAIESHYGTKRTHIPFLGLADFAVKVAHPAGAHGFKLAVFEDLKWSPEDVADLDKFMRGVSGRGLEPLVRVHSRRDGESTYIFMGEAGKSTKVLIAAFERSEATVVEVKVDMDTLLKWIDSPELAGKSSGERRDW